MNSSANDAAAFGIGIALLVFILVVALGFYIFMCYCYKRICEKAGHNPGFLIWIPIVHFIPLLEVAKLPVWTIILILIPFVNLVFFIVMWAKVCEARGKSPWLVIMIFIPLVNLVFIPYLAFSE